MSSTPISLDFHGDLARRMQSYRDPWMDELDKLCKLQPRDAEDLAFAASRTRLVARCCVECHAELVNRTKSTLRCKKCAYRRRLETDREYKASNQQFSPKELAQRNAIRKCADCKMPIAFLHGRSKRCGVCAEARVKSMAIDRTRAMRVRQARARP